MSDNIYAPPKAHIEDSEVTRKPGSIWKGVLIGGLLDIVSTMVFVVILSVVYVYTSITPDMSPEQFDGLSEQFGQELSNFGSFWGMIGVTVGIGASFLGGYICAIFAREKWKIAALSLGLVLIIFGFLTGSDTLTLGENLSLSLLTLMVIYLAGWLREGRHTKKQKNVTESSRQPS